MGQQWIYRAKPSEGAVDEMISSLGFGELASKILVMRGIDSYEKARKFFKPKLTDLNDPFLMADMSKATNRVQSAIEKKEKILIYGDYDVDGTTSVALVYKYLQKIINEEYLGFYIPNRNSEGYGISREGIDFAAGNNFKLVIALDCGIKSLELIRYANSLGVDFIICDHHLPGDTLPEAIAALDPKREDCNYPFKGLSGCGVGFKLCQALNKTYKIPEKELHDLTDLLAISIAADMVPLKDENRVLAKMGLHRLHRTQKPGLRILMSKNKIRHYSISNIIFEIAPKINATGRISHAKSAVELLITDDRTKAEEIGREIQDLNEQRREWDSTMTQEALQQIEETHQQNTFSTIVYHPDWNKGIIGIVASRLIENYYKPTVVFTDGNDGEIVASARSVSDFDLHEALEQCADLFIKFGGHRAAAGLSMKKENLPIFKKRFEEIVKDAIEEHQKAPSILIDCDVSIDDLNYPFFQFHHKLSPFGPENTQPIFVLRDAELAGKVRIIGKGENHLKFRVTQANEKKSIECVAFKLASEFENFKNKRFDLAFTIDENHWNDNLTHYLNVKDVKFK